MKRLLIVFLLMILGCSPQIDVFSDADPDYDLWTYKTYDWGQNVKIEEGKNPLHYNELNDKRIKTAVKEQMAARGYRFTSENPELIIHYHIIVKDQSAITPEPYGYRYGEYWIRADANVSLYREGTLIIDVMDRKTQNLIWRGWAVTSVDSIDPKKIEDLIRTVVLKIFKKYPKSPGRNQTAKNVVSK